MSNAITWCIEECCKESPQRRTTKWRRERPICGFYNTFLIYSHNTIHLSHTNYTVWSQYLLELNILLLKTTIISHIIDSIYCKIYRNAEYITDTFHSLLAIFQKLWYHTRHSILTLYQYLEPGLQTLCHLRNHKESRGIMSREREDHFTGASL